MKTHSTTPFYLKYLKCNVAIIAFAGEQKVKGMEIAQLAKSITHRKENTDE